VTLVHTGCCIGIARSSVGFHERLDQPGVGGQRLETSLGCPDRRVRIADFPGEVAWPSAVSATLSSQVVIQFSRSIQT
jgi:hypothetical protein